MQHEGFPIRSLLTPTTHRISFPTCLSHPRNIHLHCSTFHRLLHFPSRVSTTSWIRNSQRFVAVVGHPSREITSPKIFVTLREFLTSLKTYFFNPRASQPTSSIPDSLQPTSSFQLLSQMGNHSRKIGYGRVHSQNKCQCVQVTEVHDGW
jgi:hypothetical protein